MKNKRKDKTLASQKRGRRVLVKKTSRTPNFLIRVSNTLASAVCLQAEVIIGLMKGEVRSKFAHIVLKWITDVIQTILRG